MVLRSRSALAARSSAMLSVSGIDPLVLAAGRNKRFRGHEKVKGFFLFFPHTSVAVHIHAVDL